MRKKRKLKKNKWKYQIYYMQIPLGKLENV